MQNTSESGNMDTVARSLCLTGALVALVLVYGAGSAQAQETSATSQVTKSDETSASDQANYIERLKQCQAQQEDSARLACYDQAVGGVVKASDTGEVRIVNQEDVRKTRRSLFGFSLPDLNIFGSGKDGEESKALDTLTSTITSINRRRDVITFTIEDGDAVWRIGNAPARLRRMKVGDSVEFKKASLGSYFIRINGQIGVKGKRIQ